MTPSETRALGAIIDYQRAYGISPSLADIAARCGWVGRSTALYHVRALLAEGMLEASAGSRTGYAVSRGYRPTTAGLAAIGAPDTCPTCGQPIARGTP